MENKITSRSNKAEILNYANLLEEQLKVYEEKLRASQQNISPNVQIKREEQANKEMRLKGFCINDLNNLQDDVKTFINNFVNNLNNLELIQEQIAVEKERLENVYNIKVEAESLFAIITAKKEIIENLTNKIKNLDEYYKTETATREAELNSHLTQLELIAKYQRDEERIKFENEFKKKNQKLIEDAETLHEERLELEELRRTIAELRKVIDGFEANKQIEIRAALEMAKLDFDKYKEYETALTEAKYNKEIAILQCEIKTLKSSNNDLVLQLEHLNDLLKDSNASISQIASKTVDNYHMNKSLEDITKIAITAANSNSNSKK